MSNPSRSHPKTSPDFYSIKPRSLPPDGLDVLIQRLKLLLVELSATQIDKGLGDAGRLGAAKKDLLLKVSNYLRTVKNAQLLLHIPPEPTTFDDHDQVASSILYRFTQYEHVRASYNYSLSVFIDKIVSDWGKLLATGKDLPTKRVNQLKLRSADQLSFSKSRLLKVGFVTVLEHEYQSVVRRLDKIHACSGEEAYGLGFRYRTHPTEDLKDLLKDLTDMGILSNLDIGWTVGSIGQKKVIVICTGKVGKQTTSDSIDSIQDTLNITVENWLDVGVCAGSDATWPIGTVLVSQSLVIDIKRTASDRFEEVNKIKPIRFALPKGRKFSLKTSYRRVPDSTHIQVAAPNNIPVFPVMFACPTEVIRLKNDRNAILSFLRDKGYLNSDEEFGIEMEGAGTTLHPNSSTMCIIKAVTDYGDKKSKKSLAPGTKVLYQLYAAETAAEYAVSLVRNWTNKAVIRKLTPRISVAQPYRLKR
jgi:nucleoside phosphorylase